MKFIGTTRARFFFKLPPVRGRELKSVYLWRLLAGKCRPPCGGVN